MAKNVYLFIGSCFLIVALCGFNNSPVIEGRTTRDCVLGCAREEVGVKERTGNNDGDRVKLYLASTGLSEGYPWCAAVVAFLFGLCAADNPGSAYCPDWFKSGDVIYRRGSDKNDFDVCRPGDLIGIWFSDKRRIAHMGMIEDVEGQKVTTLEGNTNEAGGRDGEGFYRKYRLKNQIYAVSNHLKD